MTSLSSTTSAASMNYDMPGRAVEVWKYKFKTYDGNPKLWREWSEDLRVAILENPLIPCAKDKLMHVKNYLTGAAKDALAGLVACDDNLELGLQILQEQFGDPSLLVHFYYGELNYIPSLKDETFPPTDILRSNITKVQAILCSLRSSGATVDDRIISRYVMEKFPYGMISSTLYLYLKNAICLKYQLMSLLLKLNAESKLKSFMLH